MVKKIAFAVSLLLAGFFISSCAEGEGLIPETTEMVYIDSIARQIIDGLGAEQYDCAFVESINNAQFSTYRNPVTGDNSICGTFDFYSFIQREHVFGVWSDFVFWYYSEACESGDFVKYVRNVLGRYEELDCNFKISPFLTIESLLTSNGFFETTFNSYRRNVYGGYEKIQIYIDSKDSFATVVIYYYQYP